MEDNGVNLWRDPAKDHFYLTHGQPRLRTFGWYPILKIGYWDKMQKIDGSPASFTFVVIGWFVRFYFCTAKIDGTRTFMYWNGQFPDIQGAAIDHNAYVANEGVAVREGGFWQRLRGRTERYAFRFHKQEPDCEVWYNQGGI